MKSPSSNRWSDFGYYGLIYGVLLVLIVLGYPWAQQYAKPLAALIFPINEANSLVKNIVVMSAMYWGMIGVYCWMTREKS